MAWQGTELGRALFDAALAAAQPGPYVARHVPAAPARRTVVVGAGKASAAMAQALEAHWPGSELTGAVAVPEGCAAECRYLSVEPAGHPVPDERSLAAARRQRALVADLGADDLVVALISGGGSALLCEPAPGLTLRDKQAVSRDLLHSGASIGEINAVRQHVSAIKGGALAQAAAPAAVHTLVVSDVPGDDPALVASGPTVASPFTAAQAQAVLQRYGIAVPAQVEQAIAGSDKTVPAAQQRTTQVICCASQSLEAAADEARAHGYTPLILGDRIEGEAREVATVHAGIAQSIAHRGYPIAPPAVLLSGGETSVTLGEQAGRGGRNTEFLLGLAVALREAPGITALAGDTDGIDGTENNAGAVIDPTTLARARQQGLDPAAALAGHRSHALFERLDDLVVTGATRTNVNDFRAVVIPSSP
jgi:hydroxypyruvate reductase